MELLKTHYNTCQSTYLHFKHQLTLPEDLRVAELNDNDLKESIKALNVGADTAWTAIDELKKIPINASTDPAN